MRPLKWDKFYLYICSIVCRVCRARQEYVAYYTFMFRMFFIQLTSPSPSPATTKRKRWIKSIIGCEHFTVCVNCNSLMFTECMKMSASIGPSHYFSNSYLAIKMYRAASNSCMPKSNAIKCGKARSAHQPLHTIPTYQLKAMFASSPSKATLACTQNTNPRMPVVTGVDADAGLSQITHRNLMVVVCCEWRPQTPHHAVFVDGVRICERVWVRRANAGVCICVQQRRIEAKMLAPNYRVAIQPDPQCARL